MKFKIEAIGTFDAENITEAFLKISTYYLGLHNGFDPEILLNSGFIRIIPLNDNFISE